MPLHALVINTLSKHKATKTPQTLVQALCGGAQFSSSSQAAGCRVSIRLTNDNHLQEFYDVTGAPRFRQGRQVFHTHRRYDGVLFLYDMTNPATRSAISCIWVPEVMAHLGDVGAIEAGSRLDGKEIHVTSAGVMNELKFLWRQALFSHGAVSPSQAIREGFRLSWRLFRLLLNEYGIWSDSSLDEEAERLFLGTSLVPAAIIGMKADLMDRTQLMDAPVTAGRGIPHIYLHANNVAHDVHLHSFLKTVGDSVKRKTQSTTKKLVPRPSASHVMLGFV